MEKQRNWIKQTSCSIWLTNKNLICSICKRQLNIDHIIPKSKGGLNNLDNLQTLCFDCNIGKGAKW